jgi:alkyl hydroperoxide reductase subunit AhpF
MKKISTYLLICIFFIAWKPADNYDVIVYGGTPAGITAAIAAAREGRTVLLV